MPEDISKKQREIYEFINDELHTRGYPPSVREICSAVNLKSTSTVHGHLEKLQTKGYIKRDPTKPRAIEVVNRNKSQKRTREIVEVPIIGQVTAGQPILAVENIEDTFPLPVDFISNKECYILNIKGSSMIDAGILDGDYVIVEKQNTAINGDIVVALVDNEEATVKRFFKEDKRIRLQPENSTMEPIYRDDVAILGKVAGVIRRF
ncbi:transcriptional repressor LexA [Alkalibaculum sporogenes]|uniref:transcriptional repressor LexA n=1 Tax=Alkalibaculum sporogenes TaxID=2655001 RepID=UPI001FE751EA|nr:transcriptional repressor LexA [Alkalibaculum sporogenes]